MWTPGNDLDGLLGLNPAEPDAPERIWKVVSARFRDGVGVVQLTFAIESQPYGYVTIRYLSYPPEDWGFKEVEADCAALARLGFDTLRSHESGQ
jgi:hypothetical protein